MIHDWHERAARFRALHDRAVTRISVRPLPILAPMEALTTQACRFVAR